MNCTMAETTGCKWSTNAKRYSVETTLKMKHLRADHPEEATRVTMSADAMFEVDIFVAYVTKYGTTPPWHEDSPNFDPKAL